MGLAVDIPKIWTSFQWAGDVEAQVADVAAHGVEVIEAPPWNVEVCSNALRICRKYGLKAFTSLVVSSAPYDGARTIGAKR